MAQAARDEWLGRLKSLQAVGLITPRQFWVAHVLVWWQHEGGACFPSHSALAMKASVRMPTSVRTVQRALDRLYRLGFLDWIAEYVRRSVEGFSDVFRVERTSNSYRFFVPAEPTLLVPRSVSRRLAEEAGALRQRGRQTDALGKSTDGHFGRRSSLQIDSKVSEQRKALEALARIREKRQAQRSGVVSPVLPEPATGKHESKVAHQEGAAGRPVLSILDSLSISDQEQAFQREKAHRLRDQNLQDRDRQQKHYDRARAKIVQWEPRADTPLTRDEAP